jgi:hypothetical protein
LFGDLDLDGAIDFIQVNGHIQPDISVNSSHESYRQRPQLFLQCTNCAKTFELVPHEATGDLAHPAPARGLAVADFDNDGDLDLLISAVDEPLRLLRNDQVNARNWLKIRLKGRAANRAAIGAVVDVEAGSLVQRRQVKSVHSYLSQSESTLHFGLGEHETVARIRVRWPDGSIQELGAQPARQLLVIAKNSTD